MSDIYEGGSEAPDIIYCTADSLDDLMWEWASGSDLSFDFISSELKYADIEIVEDHIDLRAWEDFDEADAETEKEIESYRKGSDDDQV